MAVFHGCAALLAAAMERRISAEGLDFMALMVTDPVRGNSELLFRGSEAVRRALPYRRGADGVLLMPGVLSRRLIAAIRETPGPVVLIRGWEKPEPLQEELAAALPGRELRVRTLAALKREGADGAALIAVLQADALISRDDFRGDERAMQLVGTLGLFAPRVIIQTAVPARFDGHRTLDDLLAERREFGFPPYTRLVEVRRQGSSEVLERHFLARDAHLQERKAALADAIPRGCYLDVDPTD